MTGAFAKHLIWDFDGTLAFRQGGWSAALYTVLRQHDPHTTVTVEQIRPFLQSGFPWHAPENVHPNLSADEWWEELMPLFARAFRGVGVPSGQTIRLAQQVRGVYIDPSCWQRYEDSLPTLERLSKRGWTHILLTNHIPELPVLLDYLGLRKFFAAVYNSGETGIEKPNTRAFRPVIERIGPGFTAWVIGDSYPSDVVGAQEAGLPAILVRKPHPGAEIYCETLAELIDRL